VLDLGSDATADNLFPANGTSHANAVGRVIELDCAAPAKSDLGPLRLGIEVTGIARAEHFIDHLVG
jgi:hypothetical protein